MPFQDLPARLARVREAIERARQRKTAAEPAGSRAAKGIKPLVHRIATEFLDMGRQHWANERRDGVLGFAYCQADGRHAGLRIAQELTQPHERRAASRRPVLGQRRYAIDGVHEHSTQSGATVVPL